MPSEKHFDLVIIGSGSGNSILDDRYADWKVAMIDRGVGPEQIFGGTCLNVGCIPTKMFVHPASVITDALAADRLGVELAVTDVDWPAIRDRIFGRIDPISHGGEQWRAGQPNVTLYREQANFIGPKRLQVGDQQITADQIVLANGSRPRTLDVPGADQVTCHTSDSIMRLAELPKSLVILGGGFIAAEFAHIFSSLGVQVTVVNRSSRLLSSHDREISDRFTKLAADRWRLHLGQTVARVEPLDGGRVRVVTRPTTDPQGAECTLEADQVLVAVGRVPNADTLNLAAAGVTMSDGMVQVDEYQRTNVEGIWALGDVSSPYQLKHVANHEARVVQHNLLHPDEPIAADHRFVPGAVFTHPPVASVGLTEAEAVEQGRDFVTAVQEYASIAYGWAMEDQGHFAKLLADRTTGQLIGAHIIGPEAPTLIQVLIQAMSFGLGAREMARGQYWIHPAMPELIENALLSLPLDEA